MSVKVLRWILVISNLLLILIPISALVLSYFLLIPKILTNEISSDETYLAGAFSFWAIILPLTSICFLGIIFANSCCLHLVAAVLLCLPLALGTWFVVEQFLFKPEPNWTIVGIAFSASVIWGLQVLTELLLSCILCCSPAASAATDDIEAAKKAEAEGDDRDNNVKRRGDDGTDEEKEKLVVSFQQDQQQQQLRNASQTGQGAFVPSPQAPPIEEVDEGDEDEDDEDEEDSQARDHLIDRNNQNPNHPHDLPLRSIPEEKQYLLSAGQRPASSSSGQCPLATPEDTGV